jgi:hypothetical protein
LFRECCVRSAPWPEAIDPLCCCCLMAPGFNGLAVQRKTRSRAGLLQIGS